MRLALTAAALMVASGVAMAQTAPDTLNSAASAPAPNPAQATTAPAATPGTAPQPATGQNSFTQRQAASRIRRAGYTKVSGLKKDGQGVWRGSAQKDGSPVSVSLDYKGNVVSQ